MSNRSNHALVSNVPAERLIGELTPVCHLKAVKNEVEIAGMRSGQVSINISPIIVIKFI